MIPLLTCIGNHEAMYNRFKMPRHQIVPYLYFINHRINETMDLQRRTYHTHELGATTTLMILDSAIATPHVDQNSFIDTEMTKYASRPNKLVAYHAPLYPSYRDFNGEYAVTGRYYWEPLFNKHKVTACFEHHDHSFKRTVLINNGTMVTAPSTNGIIYLGDGAMGVEVRATKSSKWWLAKTESKTHVWLVRARSTLNGGGILARAFDTDMVEFDSVSHTRGA